MAELLVRAVDIVGDRVSSARRVNHGNPAHARTFSYDLHRALTLVRSLDLELDLYHVPALDRALNRALDLALGGAPDRARDRDRARNLARDLARDLERVLTLARDHGHNFEFAFELARALALALVLDRALDREHARALVLDRALGREHARERALDRARELACVAAEALNESLGIERLDGLADALLDGALDDFSQADLSRANPAHMRLVGVRWSMSGTRWPPGLDVGTLVQQSKETEPGSGIYVVTHGGETLRAQEETRV